MTALREREVRVDNAQYGTGMAEITEITEMTEEITEMTEETAAEPLPTGQYWLSSYRGGWL